MTADTPTPDDLWYSDGLQFKCTQCGNCCTGAPGVVWVTDDEIKDIAEALDKTIGEIKLFHTRIVGGRVSLKEFANGDCTFFDAATRRCAVYGARPTQCRTWPFWNSNLQSPADWQEAGRECPGIGSGDFVDVETIRILAEQVDV